MGLDSYDGVRLYVSLPECSIWCSGKELLQKHLAEEVSDYLQSAVELCEPDTEKTYDELEVLAARLKAMAKAECVIFPDGYEYEREGRLEYMAAKEYGKKILIEHGTKIQEEF